ncbi:MAG: hypothetical protein JO071_13885 [Deltaproteobacteria bacterium]|nr:hypothetical protein [Deltaproteobacteria bacterium]
MMVVWRFGSGPSESFRSKLKSIEEAPLFYTRGASDALLELDPAFALSLGRCGPETTL